MIPLAGLFNLVPPRVLAGGLLVLGVGGYIGFLRLRNDRLHQEVMELRSEITIRDTKIQALGDVIKIQNSAVDGWIEAGKTKQRQAEAAQADARAISQAHAQALDELRKAQAPSHSDEALVWLAGNYNEWIKKAQR